MMISSTRFGDITINPDTVITFPRGIPGFENCVRWTLLRELADEGQNPAGVVYLLQSLDDPDVTLPVADPTLFGFNYEFVLADAETNELKLEDPSDLAVLVALSAKAKVPQADNRVPLSNWHANVAAPILLNIRSLVGAQKIMAGNDRITYTPGQ